jgi:hypothetical protein
VEEKFLRITYLFSDESWPGSENRTPATIVRTNERRGWLPLRETGKPIRSILLLLLTTAMFLSAAPDQGALVTYGNLPLAFEENRGQAPLV